MTHWRSLYLWSEQTQAIVAAIQNYLEAQSYIPYNPFGRYPGLAYPLTLKTFVSPTQNNCTRILCDGHDFDALAAQLALVADCLAIALDGQIPSLHFYRNGQLIDLKTGLNEYCKANMEAQLEAVLNAKAHDLPVFNQEQIGDVPLDALPETIQEMAKQVNTQQANRLFQQLKKQFTKTVSKYDVTALLQTESDWNSQGGQYIRALMACLLVPDDWLNPDFSTLRQAYTIQSRQAYDANTPLFPGDKEALATVPNALDYVPVYGGKQA